MAETAVVILMSAVPHAGGVRDDAQQTRCRHNVPVPPRCVLWAACLCLALHISMASERQDTLSRYPGISLLRCS